MRRAALPLLILLAACASTGDGPNVTVHLAPYETAPSAYTFTGAVNVQFEMSVTNESPDQVTFNRIEIRTISSGAFTISPTSTAINVVLGPGQSAKRSIALWAYARGGRLAAEEPVTVRGTAYFTGPKGAFVRLFTEYITQR